MEGGHSLLLSVSLYALETAETQIHSKKIIFFLVCWSCPSAQSSSALSFSDLSSERKSISHRMKISCFTCYLVHEKKIATKPKWITNQRNSNQPSSSRSCPAEEEANIAAQTFTFRELAAATMNFREESLIGEGGFGRVYKGRIERIGQVVAVKQLDRNGLQGNKEFLVEVLMLSLLHHQNLVNLIGYCADGDQRLLVYEYLPLGSLEDHIFDVSTEEKKALDWAKRMKIALGAAKGLEYLHDKTSPPVIYRDLKSSNILLDAEFNAKLSDFGLAKLGPVGDKTHVSSRIMGTYGYCAPEYQRTGRLTLKSDVYSFGVVLLELVSGRRAFDTSKPAEEQNLVSWAQPVFKEPNRFRKEIADPLLQGDFPLKELNQVVAIAAMCLHEEPSVRPLMADVVTALASLGTAPDLEMELITDIHSPPPDLMKADSSSVDLTDMIEIRGIQEQEF